MRQVHTYYLYGTLYAGLCTFPSYTTQDRDHSFLIEEVFYADTVKNRRWYRLLSRSQ